MTTEQGTPAPPPGVYADGLHAAAGTLGRARAQNGPQPLGLAPDYDYAITEVLKVVDGDTLDLRVETDWVDTGFHVQTKTRTAHRFRLLGVDTPERGRPGWAEATSFVRDWLAQHPHLRARTTKTDSFGRWLVDVYDPDDHASLSAALLHSGHAEVWR